MREISRPRGILVVIGLCLLLSGCAGKNTDLINSGVNVQTEVGDNTEDEGKVADDLLDEADIKEEEIAILDSLDLSDVNWCLYTENELDELRTKYKIDDLVSECTNDLETVIAVTKWVTNLWEHDGNNVPMDNNPLYILDQVINHGERYRCVEYGTVTEAVLDSLDYQARQIYLKTSDVETREYGAGHVGCEVYLNDYNKWVFIDGQFGTIVTLQGIPLNSYEIRAALDSKAEGLDVIWVNDEKATDADDKMYYEWIYEYLFYLDVAYPKNDEVIKLMFVPKSGRAVTIFQIKYSLDYNYYISNIDDFYYGQKTQVLY